MRSMPVGRPNLQGIRRWSLLVVLLLVATGCGKADNPPGSGGSPLSIPALKLAVLDAVGGHLAYCDPDVYPIGRGDVLQNARARFPTIQADHPVFDAILQHEGLSASQKFTPQALIVMSDDYKQMQAIALKPVGTGYTFDLQALTTASATGIARLSGNVSQAGNVAISHREVGQRPNCPICLATGVLIATPRGNVHVQDIRVGMRVWTTDKRGHRIAGVVLETGHMQAPLGHEVVRLTLADGRTLTVSPGHPTADGRTVAALEAGDRYDGAVVARATLIPYAGFTWDLLPSGPTGTYFANRVLLGSTLHHAS
ncbi:MAG TPA: Hint domain-containing protein [Actinomycetota bacterium]|nr:Hint domain-containing protein [Actinomycetota bacterium]